MRRPPSARASWIARLGILGELAAAVQPAGPALGGALRGLIDRLDQWRTRLARERGSDPPDRREASFLVRLVGAALLGEAILGPILDLRAELDGEHDAQAGFRRWLAENLAGLVESS